ncbi:MAG TPA: hypothetical protein PKI11_00685 [Candidatus Hydrogenedentes bacterium]|nr:hypothetical protein [Candidatus Hydrogenedentota bacterium]
MLLRERPHDAPAAGAPGADDESGGGRLEGMTRRAETIAARGGDLAARALSGNCQAFLNANVQRGAQ